MSMKSHLKVATNDREVWGRFLRLNELFSSPVSICPGNLRYSAEP